MMRIALHSLPALTVLALAGCSPGAEYSSALPQRDNVQMRVPQSGGQALTVGETASLYEDSVRIATNVNGGVLWVFDVIDLIVAHPPTTLDETTAVWGPSEPRGLERLSYRFTVVKIEEAHFTYVLEARLKDDTGDFTEIFTGEAFPNEDNDGHGTLSYNLGSLRGLDGDAACLTGVIDVAYDAASEPRALDVEFTQVADECAGERPTNAHYVYAESADHSGQMDFAFRADIHGDAENKPLEELMSVRTRWLASGAGRSDVQVSEGEVPADLVANIPGTAATSVELVQCWDDSFALVYGDTAPDELEPHLGNELVGDASLCAMSDASFAEI